MTAAGTPSLAATPAEDLTCLHNHTSAGVVRRCVAPKAQRYVGVDGGGTIPPAAATVPPRHLIPGPVPAVRVVEGRALPPARPALHLNGGEL